MVAIVTIPRLLRNTPTKWPVRFIGVKPRLTSLWIVSETAIATEFRTMGDHKLGDGGLLAKHIRQYFPANIQQAALDNLRLLLEMAYTQGAYDAITDYPQGENNGR
jgi:hypothetical protein